MAALARGVACALRSQRELLLVTALTSGVLCQLELEMVRRVTLLALRSAMKRVIGLCGLVTTAARTSNHEFLPGCRVRVVARQAAAARDPLRVIRVHVPVALGAGSSGRCADIVRRVATGACGMRRHFGLRQHHHRRVARATWHDFALLEFVWLVAADALAMPARKQCTGRHDRLVLRVAVDARSERIGSGRVLMRMARGAHAVRRLSERCVARVNRLVTVHTGRGDRLLILVRTMAADALRRSVHDDRGRPPQCLRMATGAIFRGERSQHSAIARAHQPGVARALRAVAGEGVTVHAVGLHLRA